MVIIHGAQQDGFVPMIPDGRPEATVSALGRLEDYNIELTNVPSMWRHTRGRGVKVAILDTGVPRHRDVSVAGCKSFIPGYLDDENGHVTGVGSILSGTGTGNTGVRGVAPEAEDYYGAVLNASGAGSAFTVARGIRWAVDDVGADVINLSLGIPASSGQAPVIAKACEYAHSKGVTVVAAAGNDGDEVNCPASLDTVIAVAAVDRKLRHASFSSHGPEVEFAAGGVDVAMAYLDNGYATMSGTSFSAPVISGLAALVISRHKAKGEGRLPPDKVRDALRGIARDIGPNGRDEYTGWGIPMFSQDREARSRGTAFGRWLKRVFSR